ncbi:MAG TPA: hypothetical protein VML54_17260 [Candidatus Limnocylindrales bacterium]|nr:hypothetical protein [Candidatus Limnocylindrales bacterium]
MVSMKRAVFTGLGLGIVLALGSCGSDAPDCGANPLAAGCPPPPTTTLPAQRPPVVLDSGSGTLEFLTALFRPVAITETGSLEVTVDWTFAANDVDIFIARGNCSFIQFVTEQCAIAASAISTTSKPERARLANQPAGTYTVVVANFGPGDESIAYQVVFTPGTSSSSAGVAATGGTAKPRRLLRGRP